MKNNISRKSILISSGTYSGANTEDRAIPHSLGKVPHIVFLTAETAKLAHIDGNFPTIICGNAGAYTVTAMDSTNFYVGDAASYANSFNAGGADYHWVAIG